MNFSCDKSSCDLLDARDSSQLEVLKGPKYQLFDHGGHHGHGVDDVWLVICTTAKKLFASGAGPSCIVLYIFSQKEIFVKYLAVKDLSRSLA